MSGRRAPARRAMLAGALSVLLLLSAAGARAQGDADSTVIPEAVGYVNDVAGALEEPVRARLEGFLDQLERKTGVEFAVLIVPTTAPLDPSDYKVRVFERWKLGEKGKDNGLLLLVAQKERAVRFETGYGIEGTLPDSWLSRMTRAEMVPRLRQGDYAGAVTAGVLACAGRIGAEQGVTLEWNGRELRYRGDREFPMPSWLPVLIVFLVVTVALSVLRGLAGGGRRRRRGGWWIGPMGGGFGGGFGGFGGGFGGGGGGGGFGGFGGGSSGGGGGGGNW